MQEKELQLQTNFMLVLPDADPELVVGGIIMPGKKKKYKEGVIVDIGNNPDDERLKIGVRVMFQAYNSTKIDCYGETHYILKTDQLFGILEGKKD